MAISGDNVFPFRLKQAMEAKGLNQTTLSNLLQTNPNCKIQRQTISQYLSGKSTPDTIRLKMICEALNVSPDYLLNWKEKKKAMISQPMNGKTYKEIVVDRNRAIEYLELRGYEVVNTLFTDDWYSKKEMEKRGVVQIPLCFLAKSLENMSKCHVAYFIKGWENARGCKIEHDCAVAYGVEVIEEAETTNS